MEKARAAYQDLSRRSITLCIYSNFVSLESASQMVTPAMDIYSFGMCALETAALEIQGNGDSGSHVTEEHIVRTVESLEEPRQKDFIYRYYFSRCFS